MICAPLIHGSLFTLPSLCRFEASTSHLNNTTCKFCLCRCQPSTSQNLTIIARVIIFITFIPVTCFKIMMHDLHEFNALHGNLIFSCLLWGNHCLIFNFSLYLFNVTHFFLFSLDKQHPVWWKKLPCLSSYGFFFTLSLNDLVYTHGSVGALFPILPGGIQIQLFKGWSTCVWRPSRFFRA